MPDSVPEPARVSVQLPPGGDVCAYRPAISPCLVVDARIFRIVHENHLGFVDFTRPVPGEAARFSLDGQTFLVLEERLPVRGETGSRDGCERLTGREMQIVILVARGTSDRCIAERLGIGVHTVRTHLRRIFGKLRVHNKAAMTFRCAALLREAGVLCGERDFSEEGSFASARGAPPEAAET